MVSAGLDAAGPELAAVFADPGIVKVLHGADSDVLWLQRNFGLFVVNMFDTGQAARVLDYPSFGLAYLLQHFCAFKVALLSNSPEVTLFSVSQESSRSLNDVMDHNRTDVATSVFECKKSCLAFADG